MKKNKMMRLASVLLVLVMLTTCVISGTFAKYVTAASDTDSARVAKWGIDISVTAQTAFAKEYDKDDAGTKHAQSVIAEAGSTIDVVAPGTKGTLAIASISGTPEVAYDVSIAADLELIGWVCDNDDDALTPDAEYCPLVFTLKVAGTETKFQASDYTNLEAFEKALEKAVIEALVNSTAAPTVEQEPDVNATGQIGLYEYAANTACNASIVIEWAWAFEGDNVADTALGDLAATGVAPTVSFNLAIQATQQD